jgi:hypothetical protein
VTNRDGPVPPRSHCCQRHLYADARASHQTRFPARLAAEQDEWLTRARVNQFNALSVGPLDQLACELILIDRRWHGLDDLGHSSPHTQARKLEV